VSAENQAYVGPPEIHDAHVRKVSRTGGDLQVELETVEHRQLLLRFAGVTEVKEHRAVGMMLYAVRQESINARRHRFTFINWDDQDDAFLEVVATEVFF
jgi:hypothetical protein